MLPGHTRLRNQITEVLDLDLIKQEAENGALDISKLAEFIIGMMGTLCAPVRDEEVKRLKDVEEIVPLFRYGYCVNHLRAPKIHGLFSELDSLKGKYSCLNKKKKIKSRHFVVFTSAAHILKLERCRDFRGPLARMTCKSVKRSIFFKNNGYN